MTLDDTRALWDAEAATFDDEPDHGLRDPATRAAWRELLLEHLPPPPARVADLGCGTGTLSMLLAHQGYAVSGVDLSPEMVARARAKAGATTGPDATFDVDDAADSDPRTLARAKAGAATGLDATFQVDDAADPDLPPRSFDVVLSRHVLWALPDPAAGLARWVELLTPGGRLVLVEGSWATGAGLTADEASALVRATGRSAVVRHLREPVYWGREIDDERYLLVSGAG